MGTIWKLFQGFNSCSGWLQGKFRTCINIRFSKLRWWSAIIYGWEFKKKNLDSSSLNRNFLKKVVLKISFFWLKTNIKASYSWLKSCQSQVEMADQDLRSFKLMGSRVWDVICLHDLRLIKMFKKILKMKNSVFVLFCLILNLKKKCWIKKNIHLHHFRLF